jgi:hypothetical protein
MNPHEKIELQDTYASFGMIILKKGQRYTLSSSVPDPFWFGFLYSLTAALAIRI